MGFSAALSGCSVLILSGGRGSRMGGRDKGLIPWQGVPMIEWVHRQVRPLTDELIISCNRNIERYASLADLVVRDECKGFQGPLAGIRMGLRAMTGDWLLVVPCDLPRIDHELLEELYRAAQHSGGHSVLVKQGRHWQPLVCLLPRLALEEVDFAWSAGIRSPLRLWLGMKAHTLNYAEDDPRLFNCNSLELLQPSRRIESIGATLGG
ncbi:molybdenum cofactor guanylyltransferase MobA [Pseudomonas cavernicola]|uniref:Molybdenum cofactor guanylyltransferase n=1 Tax=Pseudomonas cavernicola TaxID=2320866 RepID=A0A418X939_9PSED|nr:molybdenum cofactor guanylyltransferase MobA [Pseudomonas cavernicola]RJG08883.1 molybdenum cofactor guanylyltransferase MobA [Pseudomonas cavernicola]